MSARCLDTQFIKVPIAGCEASINLSSTTPSTTTTTTTTQAAPMIASDGPILYSVLDRARFPNGTAYFNTKLPHVLGILPVIVHNNCIIGIEWIGFFAVLFCLFMLLLSHLISFLTSGHDSKVDRFKQYNMWPIGDNWRANLSSWLPLNILSPASDPTKSPEVIQPQLKMKVFSISISFPFL
jgi:hypothetical protein